MMIHSKNIDFDLFVFLESPGQVPLPKGPRGPGIGFDQLQRLLDTVLRESAEGRGFVLVLIQRLQNGFSYVPAGFLRTSHILFEAPRAVLLSVFSISVLVDVFNNSSGLFPEVIKVFLLEPEVFWVLGGGRNLYDLGVFAEGTALNRGRG